MRLKCTRRNQKSDPKIRNFSEYARPERNEYDLVIGQEYVAMGLGFWEGQAWVEIATDGGFILSVPLAEFEILNGTPSTFWAARMDNDGTVRLWPPSFYQEAYQSKLADREPSAVADFKRIREKLEAEDRRQVSRIGS